MLSKKLPKKFAEQFADTQKLPKKCPIKLPQKFAEQFADSPTPESGVGRPDYVGAHAKNGPKFTEQVTQKVSQKVTQKVTQKVPREIRGLGGQITWGPTPRLGKSYAKFGHCCKAKLQSMAPKKDY